MNCIDLVTLSKYFSLTSCVFLNSRKDLDCQKARHALQLLIEDRPDSAVEINKIIKQVFNHGEVLELLEDEEIGEEIEEALYYWLRNIRGIFIDQDHRSWLNAVDEEFGPGNLPLVIPVTNLTSTISICDK